MENTLELDHRPYDARQPVVCMDETTKHLTREVIEPLPAMPGQPERFDTLYQRNGVATIFMMFEPLGGWRRVSVTESKTRLDWAWQIKRLLDEDYAEATRALMVMDNLNTHGVLVALRSFCAPGSAALAGAPGISSHAQAWQLAQHGRDRTERAIASMPGTPHP